MSLSFEGRASGQRQKCHSPLEREGELCARLTGRPTWWWRVLWSGCAGALVAQGNGLVDLPPPFCLWDATTDGRQAPAKCCRTLRLGGLPAHVQLLTFFAGASLQPGGGTMGGCML